MPALRVGLNFNDDNDKHHENKGRRKRTPPKNRVDVTHICEHKMSYPGRPNFDYSIKDEVCCMCQEWDNPNQQMYNEGTLL